MSSPMMPAGPRARDEATPRDTKIVSASLPPAAARRDEVKRRCGGRPAPQAPPNALGNPRAGLHPSHQDHRGRRDARRETPSQRDERRTRERHARAQRYRRRDQLRPLGVLDRPRRCGAGVVSDGGVTVGVRANPDGTTHAGYGGVATCGSVWCCPQCAAVVATRRADELADVMRTVDDLGGSAFLLTLTMRHNTGDRLGWDRQERREWTGLENRRRDRDLAREIGAPVDEDQALADATRRDALERTRGCWDALSYGWARVTSGKQWTTDQDALGGLLGWVRVVETTHGVNGWHCHVHALLCFADDVPLDQAARMAERAFRRWQKALGRHGFDTSGDYGADGKRPGWDLRRAQLGDGDLSSYFTKLAHEVTSAHRKEGRRPGGRTPMQLGADAAETYRVQDVDRWREWQRASEGRRQITWSGADKSLRKLADLAPEQTDEEIADEEHDADERLRLSAETWGWVRASDHVTDVLEVAEDHGLDGLAAWLTEHGQDTVRGAGLAWIEKPPDPGDAPIPRDQGLGAGYGYATPAVLRPKDAAGRPQRRPSDRPPRWSDDARDPRQLLEALQESHGN